MGDLPPPLPGTALRILATSDLGAAAVPMRTSHGLAGTCAGVAGLLERERERVTVGWFDLVVGNPAYVLTGKRPWEDVARLPIAVTTAGNHEFDDGRDALQPAAARLSSDALRQRGRRPAGDGHDRRRGRHRAHAPAVPGLVAVPDPA